MAITIYGRGFPLRVDVLSDNVINFSLNGGTVMALTNTGVVSATTFSGDIASSVVTVAPSAGFSITATLTPTTSGNPASTAIGTIGWNANYIYVKTAADSGWKRVAIAGW